LKLGLPVDVAHDLRSLIHFMETVEMPRGKRLQAQAIRVESGHGELKGML